MGWSSTTWVMIFLAPILAFVLGHLYLGISRKYTARIHRRGGPPVMQQFIDVMKLFGKRESTTHSWVQDMGALFAVIGVFVSILFIPIGGEAVLSFQGDLIVLAYLLVIAPLGMALGTGATGNPNSAIGVSRGLMLMMGYELPFAMVLVSVILYYDTASLSEIVELQRGGFNWAILALPLSAIAADISLQAMLGEKPFDQPVAPSEIASGPMVEFGGKYLGMLMIWHAMSIIVEAGLFVDLFLGGGVVFPKTTLGLVGNIVIWAALALVIWLVSVSINAVFGRFKMGQSLKFYWGVPTLLALLSLGYVVIRNLGLI